MCDKASRRTSYWRNHLSSRPLHLSLFHIDILESFIELLCSFFSPPNLLPLFFPLPFLPSVCSRLYIDRVFMGLSDKRDLLFLLFFLLYPLPPVIFFSFCLILLFWPRPSILHLPHLHPPSFSFYSYHLIPILPPLASFLLPLLLLRLIFLLFHPASTSFTVPSHPLRQIATYPFFISGFLQLSEVKLGGESNGARSRRDWALSGK